MRRRKFGIQFKGAAVMRLSLSGPARLAQCEAQMIMKCRHLGIDGDGVFNPLNSTLKITRLNGHDAQQM